MKAEKRKVITQGIWLISYADFMTILMIFFLCLYGYAALAKADAMRMHGRKNNNQLFSSMVDGLKKDLGSQITIENQVNKVVVQLPQEILFKSAHADLSSESVQTMSTLAASLKQVEGAIIVEGHTDNIPVARGGVYASNWELSAARAFSVIEALKKNGISEERLSAWGFGEHRPVASNVDENGREKNRRIEIVVLKSEKS